LKAPSKDAGRPMDPLDWAVYRYLYKVTVSEHRAASLQEIVDATQFDLCLTDDMKLWWNEKDRDHCRKMWDVVQHINNSYEVDKQVYIDHYKYGLCTKKESNEYISKLAREGGSRMRRAFQLYMKGLNDGQGKIISDQNKSIPDTKQRDYIDGFVDWLLKDTKQEEKENAENK
jgi:hypothetical protein